MKLAELLTEIINAPPLPYKWKDKSRRAIIESKPLIGISVEYVSLDISKRVIRFANISFGTFLGNMFDDVNDLDIKLTGAGNPRTIFQQLHMQLKLINIF